MKINTINKLIQTFRSVQQLNKTMWLLLEYSCAAELVYGVIINLVLYNYPCVYCKVDSMVTVLVWSPITDRYMINVWLWWYFKLFTNITSCISCHYMHILIVFELYQSTWRSGVGGSRTINLRIIGQLL